MTKENRIKTLHYLGIITLTIISLYYINQLFSDQISLLKSAINAIVLPFGIALFISYLLAPIINFLETKMKIKKRWMSIVIVFFIVLVVTALFLYIIGRIIYTQAAVFIENDWDNIVAWINNLVETNEIFGNVYEYVQNNLNIGNASPILVNIVNILRSITGLIVVIVLIPVFLFFLLQDKQTIFLGIVSTLPNKYQPHVKELGKRANEVIQKYFNGRFISMFIMSILFSIMFYAFGFSLDRSLFFGFVLGFLDIIPYVGAFIGLLLPILNSFTLTDELYLGEYTFIGLILANVVLQGFQGNILQPYIMGKEVNLHPLLVLTSFIFFGALFGLAGVILAIPITGIIRTTAQYLKEIKT
jgi:putative permease